MLVLSRKQSEVIKIGDDITITVVRIGPCAVRLGIDAPRDISVRRAEIDDDRSSRPKVDRTESD